MQTYSGISLRKAIAECRRLGCRVHKPRRTGEWVVATPLGDKVRLSASRKDAPRSLTSCLNAITRRGSKQTDNNSSRLYTGKDKMIMKQRNTDTTTVTEGIDTQSGLDCRQRPIAMRDMLQQIESYRSLGDELRHGIDTAVAEAERQREEFLALVQILDDDIATFRDTLADLGARNTSHRSAA